MEKEIATIYFNEENQGFGIKLNTKNMGELDMLNESKIGKERWLEFLQGTIDFATGTLVNDCRDLNDKHQELMKRGVKFPKKN